MEGMASMQWQCYYLERPDVLIRRIWKLFNAAINTTCSSLLKRESRGFCDGLGSSPYLPDLGKLQIVSGQLYKRHTVAHEATPK